MLNSLYIEAYKKKNTIKNVDIEIKSTIPHKWENIEIEQSYEKFSLAAGDGSYNKKKFISFTLYAVGCESIIYSDNKLIKIDTAEIDSLYHHQFTEDLLRTFMEILEIKYAIKSINNFQIDHYLYDGSLYGDLIRPFPHTESISKKEDELINNLIKKIQKNLKYFDSKIYSLKLIKDYHINNSKQFDYTLFLSSIEKLILLKNLLNNNKKIITISKTSTNHDIFKSNIPDIAVFDRYTKKSGISDIIYKKISHEIKNEFLIEDKFFKNLEFTIFYLRLEDNKNVIKVELPYKASKKEVLDIVKKLKKYSTEGYPYLLKKAHSEVVISNKNMDELALMMNVHEKIGREMLK